MLRYVMTKRFSKQDWVELGLQTLRADGPDALTVERVCTEAGKTRGSFYFHFETTDAFFQEIAESWHQIFTTEITQREFSKTDRLDLLNQLASRIDLELEVGMRQLALRNDTVLEIVSGADRERIAWLVKLYEQSGKFSADAANSLASIEYAAFVGFRIVDPELKPIDAKALYDAFLKFTNRA